MFANITMIDYARPLKARQESRKLCGPYTWNPAKPGAGRGFYQASRSLAPDARGSTFRLRLEYANEHLTDSRLARVGGYWADNDCDTLLQPIIARLPHGRGFLAGWTMGGGMIASLAGPVYSDPYSAAVCAHGEAEYAAELEREREAIDAD